MRITNLYMPCNESSRQQLLRKINLLQKSLLKISFNHERDRMMLFKSLLKSLNQANKRLRFFQNEKKHEVTYGK